MKAKFEKIADREGRLLTTFLTRTKRFNTPYHFHPEVEIVAILKGSGQRIIGDHIASFGPRDIIMIGPDLPHQYISDPLPKTPRHHAEAIVIQFLPENLAPPLLNSPEGTALKCLLNKAHRGLSFEPSHAQRLIAQMRKIVTVTGARKYFALLELLQNLSETPATSSPLASLAYSPALDARNASRISRACDFIQRRFQDPIRQAEAATHVGMSPSAFSRMFQRATGLTFTAFVTRVRLGEASRQLIETDATVAEIAYRCGFTNLSNFNRRFLEAHQMTPRQHRLK